MRVLILALLAPLFVRAAFAADGSTSVDVSPLINAAIPFGVAVVGVLGSWVLLRLRAFLNGKVDGQAADALEKAMQNGLALAQSRLMGASVGPVPVNLHNAVVAAAADYATKHVPDALKQLGVTPDVLAEKLKARVALNTTPPEQSVAVPTPPVLAPVKSALLALFVGLALLGGAGMLTACSPAKPVTSADATAVVNRIEQGYVAAISVVTLYCVIEPNNFPCNSAGAMAAIDRAKDVLDLAMAKAREDIMLAQTADALTLAEKAALDALALYAKAVAAHGIKSAVPATAG